MLPAHFATSSRYILMIALLPAGCERDKAVDSPPPNGLSAEHTFLSDSSAARSRNPAPNPAALSDASINEAVLASLSRDPGVDASRISATTVNGIVELAGEARTLLTKRRAVRVAQSVKGVRVVDDRVELRLEQRPDEDLASDVSRALRQSSVTDNLRITAVAQRGVVTLAGQVRSYQELEIARRVAEGVRGVREVRNDLTFDYSSAKRDDTEIAADVRSRLRWDLLVDDGLIVVAVRDGKVRLTGNIASAAERDRAFADAWVVGTRQVDTSGLGVTWRARRLDLHRNKLLGTSDSEIRSALLAAAANDPRLARASLSVNVVQSVATLSGAVASLSAKLAAGELARNTVGVLLVKNELVVRPAEIATDEVLSERARAALLWDPEVGAQGIEVSAHDGFVTLTGHVVTAYERQQATDVVAAISGIRDLDNQLRVSHGESLYVDQPYADPYALCCAGGQAAPLQTTHTDAEIAATIRQQLRWNPLLDDSTIFVSVTGGRAVLTGDVATSAERSIATQDALRGGALEVDNRLSVAASSAAL